MSDKLDYNGAMQLAKEVEQFWMDRGLIIRTWLEPIVGPNDEDHKAKVWQVRSDLIERLDEYSRLHALLQRDSDSTIH